MPGALHMGIFHLGPQAEMGSPCIWTWGWRRQSPPVRRTPTQRSPLISSLPWAHWDQALPGKVNRGWRQCCALLSHQHVTLPVLIRICGYFLLTGPPRASRNRSLLGREWRRSSVLWIQYQFCGFPPRDKYCALQLMWWNRLPMCMIPGRELIKPPDTLPPWQHLFV